VVWRLDPHCELAVMAGALRRGEEHEDLGCGLQGPASRAVRRALDPLRRRLRRMGSRAALSRAQDLVRWAEAQPAYAALCTGTVTAGRRRLRRDVLYGSATHLRPASLHIRHATTGFDYRVFQMRVSADRWNGAHDFTHLMMCGGSPEQLVRAARDANLHGLLDDLIAGGLIGDQKDQPVPSEAHRAGVWFVGHNTVLIASESTRVLVDPWFRPWRDADPPDYKPLRPVDLGRVDAILVTHSHGDHFHLGSLLAFPRDTPILVPAVDRESILATDLAERLGQVGFTRVRALRWWEAARIGDVRIEAMPFYGEQASAIALVDPDLRNVGNTWIVRTPSVAAALLADTGRDPQGSMLDAGLEARRRWGPVDMIFGGIRGFSLYPLFLPFTSLDAMFVNVPLDLIAVRQSLMNDADALLSVAEVMGASRVVPYADGGAPWYWREGMGPAYPGYPAYPGERDAAAGSAAPESEEPESSPFPERLLEAVSRRSVRPVPTPLLLRPGDLVRWKGAGPRVGRVEGFGWPLEE
jgi:L-ascorbate metabolism protein UlaG (beta-lactamase superfamily)